MKHLNKYVVILFVVSIVFLALHAAYDGIVLGEAEDWGVGIVEYFFYLALIYLIVPPLGVFLAQRSKPMGYGIVGLYALQVMYGAGITDDRPMIGIMPRLLGIFGIQVTSIHGFGFFSVIMEILGLTPSEPRASTLFSTAMAYTNVIVNGALVVLCLLGLWMWWSQRRAVTRSPQRAEG
jgi:hypothetical protein